MRRALRVRASLAALAMASLTACSLLVDTSGLTDGPADDTPSGEGGDVRNSADGSALDGGTDSSTVVDADAATKCVASANRFCDDFDEVNPGAKWTEKVLHRGSVTFGDGNLSPPHALHASLLSGSDYGEASLSLDDSSTWSHRRCEFDLNLEVVEKVNEVDIIDFITAAPKDHNLYMASYDGDWFLAEYQSDADGGPALDWRKALSINLPIGTWFHVVLDTSKTEATLIANGAMTTLTGLSIPSTGKTSIVVGIAFADKGVMTGSVYVDNVDCSTLP